MKMAIIGFGGMAQHHKDHIVAGLNRSDYPEKIEIVGVYDISKERQEAAVAQGLRAYNCPEEIYNDPSIELVLVATPNDLHCAYVKACLAHGKNVITEKPMAMNTEEVKEMYAAAHQYGGVYAVHQNRRWDDDYLSMKRIYDEGEIGQVYRIESRVMGSNGIPGAWRKVFAQGGGMMLDWGVHLIDQMLQMVQDEVVSVYCDYSYVEGEEVDDGFDLLVKFKGGLEYRVVVDTNTFIELPRWQMYGTDGTATVSEWRGRVDGRVVRVVQRHDDQLAGVKAGNGLTKTMAARRDATQESYPLTVVAGDPNAYYSNFVDAIRKGTPTYVTETQALRVFAVMEAAFQSAKTGEVVHKAI